MKKLLLNVLTCALTMAGSTQGAWAYSIPEGYEVKDVLLGTLENGDVSAETFEADDAALANWTNSGKFSIVEEVPTDVWNSLSLNMSGKTMRLGSRTTHDLSFATTKTSGKVIFSTDIYVGTHAKKIQFIDANDNIIAYFLYPDKSASNSRVYSQQYLYAGDSYKENATLSGSYLMNDTYQGTRNREYQITEFVIDLDNNTISYSGKLMDRRNSTNKWCTDNASIAFSTDIAGIKGIRIDATGCGSATFYAYFDNMLLYNVDKKAGIYTYTVNAVCNGEKLQEIASGVTDGENDKTVYYPYAINANGSWYITTSDVLGTNITETGEINVPCEKKPYMVAFTEGEAGEANTTYMLGYSNGLTGYVKAQNYTNRGIAMGTLAPGKYRFVTNVISNAYRGVTLRDQSSIDAQTNIIATTDNSSTGVQTIEFTLENSTTIVLCGKNSGGAKANQSADFDYAYIEKTAEAISLPYTYTTFSSTAALDFTDNADVEAYMAQMNGDGTAVTLKQVQKVPAGAGVVLKKISDAETTTVNVLESAADLAGNQLVGVTEDNTVSADQLIEAGNAYVLVEEQFCKVVTGATGYIPAGKAYLSVPVRNAAKALRLDFNGTPTEVVSVAEKAEKAQDAIYNVQGIRVQKPTVPGLYIVNGKTYRF